jgi:hypothetical protein
LLHKSFAPYSNTGRFADVALGEQRGNQWDYLALV